MTKKAKTKPPYDERSDDEKLESNWKKAKGHYDREDWSACVIRIATSSEIAANIYVRSYLQVKYELPVSFVDSLLVSANGLDGKFKKLIIPASKDEGTWEIIKPLQKKIEFINRHRNEIAHSGKFKNKSDAKSLFQKATDVVSILAPNAIISTPEG